MNNHLSLKEIIDLMEAGATVTQEQMQETMKYLFTNLSPYMVAIDAMVKDTNYGELDMKVTVRAGEVEKIHFYQGKTWMKPKA